MTLRAGGGEEMNKDVLFNQLVRAGQRPRYANQRRTIIETDTYTFYVLSYSGHTRVGWTLQDSVIRELQKHYPNHYIILINRQRNRAWSIHASRVNDMLKNYLTNGEVYKVDENRTLLKYVDDPQEFLQKLNII